MSIACVSGYFDPIHIGHIEYFKSSCVDYVVKSINLDRTVCATLASVTPKPDFFCNGGDQNNHSIPEADICNQLGIELRDGFGEKIQSSSWLIKGTKG